MRPHTRKLDRANIQRVRKLRREMSVSEKVLWQFLEKKRMGFGFRTQHPVGEYALDFYCPEAALCVEVDGELHAERAAQDRRRDAWLEGQGIKTIRIPSMELFDETGGPALRWLRAILAACEERSGRKGFMPF